MATDKNVIHGQCFCTGVKFEITGVDPLFQGYDHCESCQKRHSAPVIAAVAFQITVEEGFADKEGKLKCTQGADLVTSYQHTPTGPKRAFCKRCGSSLANIIPGHGLFVTFPRVIAGDGFTFKPSQHNNYADKLLPVPDGLPKLSGFMGSASLEEGSFTETYEVKKAT